MQCDLYHEVLVDELFPYAANTNADTAIVSNIIDTQGYNSLTLCLHTHALTDADATATVLVEDGDVSNLSDNAAVADAQLLGTEAGCALTFADDAIVTKIGYRGTKRYVSVTVTPSGNGAGNWAMSGVAILGHPRTGAKTTQSN
jgi:hypothetical protein